MSFTAAHESTENRRICETCQQRKARFQYRGRVRADRNHTLCFGCFRSQRDRLRARLLAEVHEPTPLRSPLKACEVAARRRLSNRQLAHRRVMLEHLARHRAAAGKQAPAGVSFTPRE